MSGWVCFHSREAVVAARLTSTACVTKQVHHFARDLPCRAGVCCAVQGKAIKKYGRDKFIIATKVSLVV